MKLTLILCALALVTVANAANLRTEAPAKTKQPAQKPAPGGAQKPAAPVAAVDPCAQYSMMGSAKCGKDADNQCNMFAWGHAAAMDHCIKAPEGCKWKGDPHWDKADTNKPVHVYHEDPHKNDADKEKGFKWQEKLNKQVCSEATEMERIKSTPMMNIKGARKARKAGAKPAQPAAPVAAVDPCAHHSMSFSKACLDDEDCLQGSAEDDSNKKKDCVDPKMNPKAKWGCTWVECKGPKHTNKCDKPKEKVKKSSGGMFSLFKFKGGSHITEKASTAVTGSVDVSWCESTKAPAKAGPVTTVKTTQAVQPDGVDGPGY